MSTGKVNFGIDLASTGPRVLADAEGATSSLDLDLLMEYRDGWIVPVFPAGGGDSLLPDFRSVRSLLGRTDGLNFGGRSMRKPHFIVREAFETLGRVARNGYGRPPGEVVVSVSAFYQEQQRHYLLQCAKQAEIENVHLIDDSTATALGHLDDLDDGRLLVVNLGFERCELAVADLGSRKLSTRAYEQCRNAGGQALSAVLMKSVVFSLDQEKSRTISENFTPADWLRFFRLIESGKQSLAVFDEHQILLERDLTGFADDLAIKYSSSDLRNVIYGGFEELCESIERLLSQAEIKDGEIRAVLIGGGGAHNPYLQALFRARYGERMVVAHDLSAVQGCVQWARAIASPRRGAAVSAHLVVPEPPPDEETVGALIRGSVEVVDEQAKSRRPRERVPGMAIGAIHALVRQKAASLYKGAKIDLCKQLFGGLEQVMEEFRPRLAQAPAPPPPAAATERGEFPATYRARVRKISDGIKKTFEQANATEDAQQEGVLLDRAVQLSHDIELFARRYADTSRLEAVVQVHNKSAELMVGRDDWDGSNETTFILCEKWLLCGLRTVNENQLSQLRPHIADCVVELYCTRIRFLLSIEERKKALALRNKFLSSFSDAGAGVARLDECLAGRAD